MKYNLLTKQIRIENDNISVTKTNKYMSYKIVESREIVWCEDDDRYILIVRENNEIIGINYMQGEELPFFTKHYSGIDEDLTNFYKAIVPYLDTKNDEIEKINMAIWAHFDYHNAKDLVKFNNKL